MRYRLIRSPAHKTDSVRQSLLFPLWLLPYLDVNFLTGLKFLVVGLAVIRTQAPKELVGDIRPGH